MIGNIVVLSGVDTRVKAAFDKLQGFAVTFVAEASAVPSNADCVVVSYEYAGTRLPGIVQELRTRRLPVAAASFISDEAQQNALSDCGADDVIFLPLCPSLLQKRLNMLMCSIVKLNVPLDFEAFERIRDANQERGAYLVEEHDFTTVYRFISRILERLDKQAQLVIFDFINPLGSIELSEDIRNFSKIVRACLRRGDIFAVCDTRILLILVGTNLEDGLRVIKRLTDTFESHFYNSYSKIRYEMREINK